MDSGRFEHPENAEQPGCLEQSQQDGRKTDRVLQPSQWEEVRHPGVFPVLEHDVVKLEDQPKIKRARHEQQEFPALRSIEGRSAPLIDDRIHEPDIGQPDREKKALPDGVDIQDKQYVPEKEESKSDLDSTRSDETARRQTSSPSDIGLSGRRDFVVVRQSRIVYI